MSEEPIDIKLNPSSVDTFVSGGVHKGYLYAFITTVGIGSFQYGYSIGVYNNLQDDFRTFNDWDDD